MSSGQSDYGVVLESGALRFERLLPGPVERVWAFLTDSDLRSRWLAGGEMELRPGGRAEFVFNTGCLHPDQDSPPEKHAGMAGEVRFEGRIITCEPPRLLVFTWPEESGIETEVRFELIAHQDKVRLILTHQGLNRDSEFISVCAGWHTHLDVLSARMADGEPPRFWALHSALEEHYQSVFADAV
jgi:uncharacterized protein YndB with AHSA1/START domain